MVSRLDDLDQILQIVAQIDRLAGPLILMGKEAISELMPFLHERLIRSIDLFVPWPQREFDNWHSGPRQVHRPESAWCLEYGVKKKNAAIVRETLDAPMTWSSRLGVATSA